MTTWRKSSYSNNGKCVEIADTGGSVLVRNSQHPDRGTITLSPAAVAAFVADCSVGELDDLT
jgi:hypothetical protein